MQPETSTGPGLAAFNPAAAHVLQPSYDSKTEIPYLCLILVLAP